jgi:hypothetical protein
MSEFDQIEFIKIIKGLIDKTLRVSGQWAVVILRNVTGFKLKVSHLQKGQYCLFSFPIQIFI